MIQFIHDKKKRKTNRISNQVLKLTYIIKRKINGKKYLKNKLFSVWFLDNNKKNIIQLNYETKMET